MDNKTRQLALDALKNTVKSIEKEIVFWKNVDPRHCVNWTPSSRKEAVKNLNAKLAEHKEAIATLTTEN